MQSWDEASKATAYGITIHGDEGQAKRKKNVLVLSWSPIAVTKETMYSKFPFLATWSQTMSCID